MIDVGGVVSMRLGADDVMIDAGRAADRGELHGEHAALRVIGVSVREWSSCGTSVTQPAIIRGAGGTSAAPRFA
jgi:hypothetical protein